MFPTAGFRTVSDCPASAGIAIGYATPQPDSGCSCHPRPCKHDACNAYPPVPLFSHSKKRGVCGIACICRHVVLLASLSYFVLSSYASIAGMMFAMGFISHVVFRFVVAPRCLIFAGFGLECCRCSVKHAVMVGWRLTPIWLVRWHDCNQLRNHARDVAVSCRYVRLFWLHRWNRRQRLWFVRHIDFLCHVRRVSMRALFI